MAFTRSDAERMGYVTYEVRRTQNVKRGFGVFRSLKVNLCFAYNGQHAMSTYIV